MLPDLLEGLRGEGVGGENEKVKILMFMKKEDLLLLF